MIASSPPSPFTSPPSSPLPSTNASAPTRTPPQAPRAMRHIYILQTENANLHAKLHTLHAHNRELHAMYTTLCSELRREIRQLAAKICSSAHHHPHHVSPRHKRRLEAQLRAMVARNRVLRRDKDAMRMWVVALERKGREVEDRLVKFEEYWARGRDGKEARSSSLRGRTQVDEEGPDVQLRRTLKDLSERFAALGRERGASSGPSTRRLAATFCDSGNDVRVEDESRAIYPKTPAILPSGSGASTLDSTSRPEFDAEHGTRQRGFEPRVALPRLSALFGSAGRSSNDTQHAHVASIPRTAGNSLGGSGRTEPEGEDSSMYSREEEAEQGGAESLGRETLAESETDEDADWEIM